MMGQEIFSVSMSPFLGTQEQSEQTFTTMDGQATCQLFSLAGELPLSISLSK
jgi:hypothetical protein